ncbi:hypothetical protein MBFIL_05600 [Methanobrevibacter filiformis]|uniref:Uncharacterized protein n=1 Tax=Methanobrevibacter filiformis TaxID=55758 RepID=A0A166DZI1_9EURY|nr:hypothetical protein MBFIL_05600 [Methanobrevibacter filiformis]
MDYLLMNYTRSKKQNKQITRKQKDDLEKEFINIIKPLKSNNSYR